MTGRERVLTMLAGGEPDRLPLMPITMMFAARHIGAKYRDYAARLSRDGRSPAPHAETFGFDYVSGISDPAREASDLGAAIEWFDDQPPAIVESQALLAEKSQPDRARPTRSGNRAAHARPRGGRAPAAPKRVGRISAGGRLGGRPVRHERRPARASIP